MRITTLLLLVFFSLNTCKNETPMTESSAIDYELFVGTYTKKEGHVDGKAEGIGRFKVDQTGALSDFAVVGNQVINPSYLQLSPDGQWLFAASETGPDVDTTGYVYAYRRGEDGNWDYVNRQSSHSFAPCYISVHSSAPYVLVANYVGGTVCAYRYSEANGLEPAHSIIRLEGSTAHPRQESSHPHAAVLGPDEKFCYVPDLGANKIWIFAFDETDGTLKLKEDATVSVTAEAGPRHLIFHPNGKLAFLASELNNQVSAYRLGTDGYSLELIAEYSTLPSDFTGESYVADIHLTPDGQHLYVSNRGHNSLAHFKVGTDGSLSTQGHYSVSGDFPRNFNIHPSGKLIYVANQNSSNIVSFTLDPASGKLSQLSNYESPTPVCLQFGKP